MRPYGNDKNERPRCINAEPGTYGRECRKPAKWIGTKSSGFEACFCDKCKEHGFEATNYYTWRPVPLADHAIISPDPNGKGWFIHTPSAQTLGNLSRYRDYHEAAAALAEMQSR